MDINPTPFEALKSAHAIAGSYAALARICEVSTTAVWKWFRDEKPLDPKYARRVEAGTGVSRYHLCPEIFIGESGAGGAGSPPACTHTSDAGGASSSSKPGEAA